MENTDEHIEHFIKHVKNRLNKHFGLTVLISSLAAGGVIMTVIALCYIFRGYHVPFIWYPVCFASSLFLGACFWLYFRNSHDQAARFTDKFFALKDTVRSYSGFHKHKRSSGFYKLQAVQTENSISSISINKIKYKCPFAVLVIGIVLILTSALMGFKDDSPLVRERMEREKLMLSSTELINKKIDELMEQMQKELEEKELDKIVDMNEVRQKAEDLEETTDIKEAMRQYAQLERELGEVLSKLMQRQDEQLLERMGEQLKKDDDTKALGNQLTQKEYDSAAKEMEKFEIDPEADLKLQKEQIEKLKEMAARMAQEIEKNGATATQQSSQGQNQNSQQKNQNQQGSQNQQGNSQKNQQSAGSRLAQMTQQLNQTAQSLSQAMQQAMNSQSQNQQNQNGQPQSQNSQQPSGQMQQMMQSANQSLGNMSQFLGQMDARRQAQAMMQSMLNSLTQSQGNLGQVPGNGQMPGQGTMPGQNGQGQGQGQEPGQGQGQGQGQNGQPGQDGGGVGGRDAGTGSSNTRNNEAGKEAPAGELTRLQGVHNNGTSTTSLEESGSGSGSSLGTLDREPEEYMRQVESFIRREDVPESVKAGVKAYFENIHKVNEEN